MALTAGDYNEIVTRLLPIAPAGRRLVMLEGGYDLDALRVSTTATVGALLDTVIQPEEAASIGSSLAEQMIERIRRYWIDRGLLVA